LRVGKRENLRKEMAGQRLETSTNRLFLIAIHYLKTHQKDI
jgi:hypothetical protein